MKRKIYISLMFALFLLMIVIGIVMVYKSSEWAFEYAEYYRVFEVVKENYAGYRDFKVSELNTYRECLSNQRCVIGGVIALIGGGGALICFNDFIKTIK